jgi:uncharacterized LabA/DUF88 family protein
VTYNRKPRFSTCLAANFFGYSIYKYAILIGGGFATRKIGSNISHATAADFEVLIATIRKHQLLDGLRLHRIYYYHSEPLKTAHDKPIGGGKIEFANQPIVARSKKLHDQLVKLPFLALILGELSFHGWAVNQKKLDKALGNSIEIKHEDLKPNITQKGVDMRIGLDIAALTLKKQVEIIVLVTGDSDFVPAMKFARREGAPLYLVPLNQHIRPEMYAHSDMIMDISVVRASLSNVDQASK